LHIAFLTPEFPHKSVRHSAGIGTSIYNICLGLVHKGVKVSVIIYGQSNTEMNYYEFEGIHIYILKNKKHNYLGWFFNRKCIQKEVNSIIKKTNIDLLEAPDWTGITAFMKFTVPLVIRLHGSDAFFCKLENRKQKRKNYLFEKMAIYKASALVSVSNFAAKTTLDIFHIDKKCEVIPNGIYVQKFVNKHPKDFNRNCILYYGTIIRKKGVLELAKIFNKVVAINDEAKLLLIGKDAKDVSTGQNSTYSLMKEFFSKKALSKVDFMGAVPYNTLQDYIKKSHICVFPSLAESFGMVTIEAMAMQKVVVNSNYEWVQEIIENHKDGFLEDPKNHSAFSQKICNLLKDDILCEKIAHNARIKVEEKFDIFKISDKNINFYKSVIKNQ